jgi:CMP-N,N'-diacetyllegionaminic acid synthase
MKILAIIPARSGSKSIKNKNIILYKRKPLLAHSILAAKNSKKIDKVIVSTDSTYYKILAESYGAEVPFLRPKKISSSKSLDIQYIKHCCNFLEKKNYYPGIVVLLRPTTPNRNVKILDKGIKYFLKNINKFDSMRSVSIFNQPPHKMFKIKNNRLVGFFDDYLKGEYYSQPRQIFPQTYLPNGYIDIYKPSFFLNKKKDLCGRILPFITEETIDIDDKNDLKLKKKKS